MFVLEQAEQALPWALSVSVAGTPGDVGAVLPAVPRPGRRVQQVNGRKRKNFAAGLACERRAAAGWLTPPRSPPACSVPPWCHPARCTVLQGARGVYCRLAAVMTPAWLSVQSFPLSSRFFLSLFRQLCRL